MVDSEDAVEACVDGVVEYSAFAVSPLLWLGFKGIKAIYTIGKDDKKK